MDVRVCDGRDLVFFVFFSPFFMGESKGDDGVERGMLVFTRREGYDG